MHRSFSWFCHAAAHVIQDNTTVLVACFDWLFHCTCTYIFCFACLIGWSIAHCTYIFCFVCLTDCSSVHSTYNFCFVCLAPLDLHFLFLSVSSFVSLSLILTFFVFVCFKFCFIVPYSYIFCFCLFQVLFHCPLFLHFLFLSVSSFVSLSLIRTIFLYRFWLLRACVNEPILVTQRMLPID